MGAAPRVLLLCAFVLFACDGEPRDSDGADTGEPNLGAMTLSLADADGVLLGVEAGDYAGHGVAAVGDLDGDGLADLFVGAPCQGSAGAQAGAAYLVLGPIQGEHSLAEAAHVLWGEAAGDLAALVVAGAGDQNGDGLGDLLVGADGQDGAGVDAGAVYLISGAARGESSLAEAHAILLGDAPGDGAGAALGTAADMDGDGVDELLIGCPAASEGRGAVWVVPGGSSGVASLSELGIRLAGPAASSFTGKSVVGAGDVDGDGHGDLLVGAPGWNDAQGVVWLVSGPVIEDRDLAEHEAAIMGEGLGQATGMAVAGVPDLDGDGRAEVLVGAIMADGVQEGAGSASLFMDLVVGTAMLGDADATLPGALGGDYTGFALSVAGDMRGDGLPTMLVGVPQGPPSSAASDRSGQAWLLSGSVFDGTLGLGSDDLRLDGEQPGDRAGLALAGLGDINGDGLDDVAVGAYQHDVVGEQAGAVYLLCGGRER